MKELSVKDAIESRHSIRKYKEEALQSDVIKKLLNLAVLAPTGSNIQPWRFVVINDPKLIRVISSVSPGINGNPPCIICFCSDREDAFKKGGTLGSDEMATIDVSLAAANVMLAATSFDLGTCVIKSYNEKLISRLLELPDTVHVEMLMTMGVPDGLAVSPKRKPIETLTYENKWGIRYE